MSYSSSKQVSHMASLYESIYTKTDTNLEELKLFMIDWHNMLVENGLIRGDILGEEVLINEGFWDSVAKHGPKVVGALGTAVKQVTGYATKPTTRLGKAVRIGQQVATPLVATDSGGTRSRLTQAGQDAVKGFLRDPKKGSFQDSFDVFDVIKGHLLDEGYADTEDAALKIMANMSEEWRQSIVEAAGGYSTRPGDGKPYKEGPLWDGPETPVKKPTPKPQRKPAPQAPMRDEPLW